SWGSASSPPVRRRPRGGWSACTVPIRTGWSRSCGWPQSATMTMPMLICRSITSPSTIATNARPAAAEADYHRQRPTARQLDDVFWLEEERVLSEDWVVRYKNRLLQLARQNRHWAPAQSRVRVRENEPGHIVIHYRGQSLPFREIPLASSTARSRGRGAAPSPATPSPKPTAAAGRPHRSPAGNHPWRQGWQNMKTPAFSPAW